ncbi:MAG: L-lactate permease [Planctomycetota bacterium]
MLTVLAFAPIALLLVLCLTWTVRAAVFVTAGVTAGLLFVLGGSGSGFAASLIVAGAGTVTILFIVVGAILLYAVMQQTGLFDELKQSLDRIHPDRQVRFFFLALFLTAFFESVAGFGTPGVVVPLLLVGMGFSPVLSVVAVLLFNGLFAVSGAIGTPVTVGLEGPLGLDGGAVSRVYFVAGVGVAMASVAVFAFVSRAVRRETDQAIPRQAWAMLGVIMVGYAVFAPFLQELTGIAAAGVLAVFGFGFVFTDRRVPARPWVPYGVLVVLLLLPKIVPPMAEWIGVALAWRDVFGTEADAVLRPLRTPLVPFLAAAGVALLMAGTWRVDVRPVLSKAAAVGLILFPSLAITQFMLAGDDEGQSMVTRIADVFAATGPAYPLLAPYLGVLGAFMTGSTTVSNVIFGPVQHDAAVTLGYDAPTILGVQLAGASLGNAVCLFNVIAAAAVVGLSDYQPILRSTIVPTVVAAGLVAAVGYVLLWL